MYKIHSIQSKTILSLLVVLIVLGLSTLLFLVHNNKSVVDNSYNYQANIHVQKNYSNDSLPLSDFHEQMNQHTPEQASLLNHSVKYITLIFNAFLLLTCILAGFIIKVAFSPLTTLSNDIQHLAKGKFNAIDYNEGLLKYEYNAIKKDINFLAKNLEEAETTILNMAEGRFDYNSDNAQHTINKALASLCDNIRLKLEEDKHKQILENQNNWTTQGIAKFNEIIHKEKVNLRAWGFNVISTLVEYLKLNQCGLFVLNQEDKEDAYYELISTIAYNRQKMVDRKIYISVKH